MKRRLIAVSYGLLVLCAATAAALAPDGPLSFDLTWRTVDGGGGTIAGATFKLSSTIGQPDAATLTGGVFELNGGFWGARALPCPADVNGDGVVDVLDLLEVLTHWGPCPGCPADINNDGVVDVLDLLEVLVSWGACP